MYIKSKSGPNKTLRYTSINIFHAEDFPLMMTPGFLSLR